MERKKRTDWVRSYANRGAHLPCGHTASWFSLLFFHLSEHSKSKCCQIAGTAHFSTVDLAHQAGSLAWAEKGPAGYYKYADDSLLILTHWLSDTVKASQKLQLSYGRMTIVFRFVYSLRIYFSLLVLWSSALTLNLMPLTELYSSERPRLPPPSLINLMNYPWCHSFLY